VGNFWNFPTVVRFRGAVSFHVLISNFPNSKDDEIHDALYYHQPIVVSTGPFRILPTKNRLYWGFPLDFWIVLAVLVGIGIVLVISTLPEIEL
jgi:hypothetical protein